MHNVSINKLKKKIKLWFFVLLYAVALCFGYIFYMGKNTDWYPIDIEPLKCLYAVICISILHFAMDWSKRQASCFFLQFFFMLQIIPIAVIYSMKNENSIFFSTVCLATLLCIIFCNHIKSFYIAPLKLQVNWWVLFAIFGLIFFLFYRYKNYGLPPLTALNIYDVYDLRASGVYSLSKYTSYLQALIIKVIIPILLTKFLVEKRWFAVMAVLAMEGVIYLYAGQKFFLFSGILVVAVVLMCQRYEKFTDTFWRFYIAGYIILCALCQQEFIGKVYSLLVRRVLMVSADNKFHYYDFFRKNELEGWSGIFPRWLINIPSHYDTSYSYIISDVYYNKPDMQSNTGFLAEGYLRWGLLGIFVVMIVFGIVLKLLDSFQKRTSYTYAIGVGVIFVFELADGHLIDSLIFGYNMVWLLYVLLYKRPKITFKRHDRLACVSNLSKISVDKLDDRLYQNKNEGVQRCVE